MLGAVVGWPPWSGKAMELEGGVQPDVCRPEELDGEEEDRSVSDLLPPRGWGHSHDFPLSLHVEQVGC